MHSQLRWTCWTFRGGTCTNTHVSCTDDALCPIAEEKGGVVEPLQQLKVNNITFHSPSIQVWFQNCRARQKKYISPNPASTTMMTSLAPGQLTPPFMEDLQYTTYISPDAPLLTTLTYMDGNKHDRASVCFFTIQKYNPYTANSVFTIEIIYRKRLV